MNYIAANGYELYRCSKEAMRSCGLSKKTCSRKILDYAENTVFENPTVILEEIEKTPFMFLKKIRLPNVKLELG